MANIQDLKIIIAEQIMVIYDMRKEMNNLKLEINKLQERGLKDAGSTDRGTVHNPGTDT